MAFLYEKIKSLKEFGTSKEIPSFITDNLSSKISLRDYQKDAIEYTLLYLDSPISKSKQTHILYHMATGSGKTVIMAMNILYYYKLGYRNFIFFTNQTNIVSKTRINFLDKSSSKYLFADTLQIDGKEIKIKEVSNFQYYDHDAINICFNTVQGIHSSLGLIKENSLTIEDFQNEKVVLIADEAHHLNSTTSKDKDINEENKTWEDTINSILYANKDNVLLEYTATCDVKDPNVLAKYLDKMIFNFNLKEFREAGYTKEFANMQTNTDMWTRTVQALIMSEHRKVRFEEKGIDIKPVVLLKSKTIKESNSFYDEFYHKLKYLDGTFLEQIRINNLENYLFVNAFAYFKKIGVSNNDLAELIKIDFSQDNSVNMNDWDDKNEEIVNNLDEKGNRYRLIFIVDKLTEGWDVLSLFDIVRLYETRQGGPKGRPSNYTISEAQLIGRGARYCPFKFSDEQPAEKRKYSNYLDENAICETLLYHCMQEAKYISELKLALKQTGLIPDDEPIRVEYKIKTDFKKTQAYLEGFVFTNNRVEVSRDSVHSLPYNIANQTINYNCSASAVTGMLMNDEVVDTVGREKENVDIKMKDIWYPVVFKAFRCFSATLSFDKLKKQFPHLKTIKEFLVSDDYVGNIIISFNKDKGVSLSNEDLLEGCKKVFQQISDYITKIEITFKGTTEFVGKQINKAFADRVRNYTKEKGDESWGNGVSQASSMVDSRYRLELFDKDWYVYNDNCGTSEEKKFVKYFSTIVEDLKKTYSQVYLIRNELEIAIYDFDTGDKFEPDFVLLLRKKKSNGKFASINLFIEPKGEHLLEHDAWKNKFMLELHDNGIPTTTYVEDDEYLIWGTPLYNENATKQLFVEYTDKVFDELKKL